MTREIIENYRKIILPFVKKRLLEINYENQGESDADEFEKDFNEILDLAAKALEQEPRWIPISERLPEEEETVIASTEYRVYPETRYTKGYGWEWAYEAGADYWESLEGVMAWMPLPESYKAESEDKE